VAPTRTKEGNDTARRSSRKLQDQKLTADFISKCKAQPVFHSNISRIFFFQGHCLTTITPPVFGGYDIEDAIYTTTDETDRYISTEGCFSCKVRQY